MWTKPLAASSPHSRDWIILPQKCTNTTVSQPLEWHPVESHQASPNSSSQGASQPDARGPMDQSSGMSQREVDGLGHHCVKSHIRNMACTACTAA